MKHVYTRVLENMTVVLELIIFWVIIVYCNFKNIVTIIYWKTVIF